MDVTLVVLAAGMGSRYGGLKQLDGFGPHDEPLLLYSIFDAIRAGFTHIVFVIRQEFSATFEEKIGNIVAPFITVSYAYQEKDLFVPNSYTDLLATREKPRGTGHAVLVTKELVNNPFAVINADDFYGRHAYVQIADFLNTHTEPDIGMVGYVFENTLSDFGSINRGVCEVQNGLLKHVDEHVGIVRHDDGIYRDNQDRVVHKNDIVSMNFRGFYPSFFTTLEEGFLRFLSTGGQGEYYIPLAVDTLTSTQQARCHVMMSDDVWCGVSYQGDKPFVQKTIASLHAQGVYPEKLFI